MLTDLGRANITNLAGYATTYEVTVQDIAGLGPVRARVAPASDHGQRIQFLETPPATTAALNALMRSSFSGVGSGGPPNTAS